MGLEEALAAHGITLEDLYRDAMLWLGSVPEGLRARLESDPPALARLVEEWDFYFSAGMSPDYPDKRGGWSLQASIREFLQNALDASEEARGRAEVEVFVDEGLGLCIRDRGGGFARKAWRLGGTEKPAWMRGCFGEGMKVASAYLVKAGITPYIFTGDKVYKVLSLEGSVAVVVGRSKIRVEGTLVALPQLKRNPAPLDEIIFQSWVKKFEGACQKPKILRVELDGRPSFIVLNADEAGLQDRLFVRDIYVNSISKIASKPSFFTYNLWWVRLHPNRTDVASLVELEAEVARLWNSVSDEGAVRDLLDRMLQRSPGVLAVKEDYFETSEVEWYYGPLSREVGRLLKAAYPNIGKVRSEAEVDWYRYLGVDPVLVVNEETSALFLDVPDAGERVAEIVRREGREAVSAEEMTWDEYATYNVMKLLVKRLNRAYGQKGPRIMVKRGMSATGRANVDTKEIYVNFSMLRCRSPRERVKRAVEIVGHEYAHILTRRRDLDPAFMQTGLCDVYSRIAEALAFGFGDKVRKAASGCINPAHDPYELEAQLKRLLGVSAVEPRLKYMLEYGDPPVLVYRFGEVAVAHAATLSSVLGRFGKVGMQALEEFYSKLVRGMLDEAKEKPGLPAAWYDIFRDEYRIYERAV